MRFGHEITDDEEQKNTWVKSKIRKIAVKHVL